MWALETGPGLTEADLRTICKLVYERSGITLHDGKRELVVARLQKRLRHHRLASFKEYLRLVEGDRSGEELVALLDAIATNHTSFFREAQHFEILRRDVLPALSGDGRREPLAGWSAACSTGEEPYTIAITLLEAGCASFTLLASDLSTKALAIARRGVYRLDRVHDIPQPLLRQYFEKGLGAQDGLARVGANLRRFITFDHLNLLEVESLGRQFQFIFCRNVMIYFDKRVQQRVVSMLQRHLGPGGYLFISHSESLNGVAHQLQWVAPAVYRKPS